MSSRPLPETVWRSPSGEIVSCVEKLKVLSENLEEIQQLCQDALEDALLAAYKKTPGAARHATVELDDAGQTERERAWLDFERELDASAA